MQYRNDQGQKLVGDIRRAMSDLEVLLRDSASDAGSGLTDMKDRLRDRFGSARETLSEYEREAADRARSAAYATDDYVRSHTWSAIGMAVAAGVLLGLMMNNRR
jgi:ElaB/YqjD/DUF883 family membrane-anchored ribosome-binding protein